MRCPHTNSYRYTLMSWSQILSQNRPLLKIYQLRRQNQNPQTPC
jgi:hypothetical protein